MEKNSLTMVKKKWTNKRSNDIRKFSKLNKQNGAEKLNGQHHHNRRRKELKVTVNIDAAVGSVWLETPTTNCRARQ